MPFRHERYSGVFGPDELILLQEAYNRCCEILGRDPLCCPHREQLARYVLRAFEDYGGDPEYVAKKASEVVLMLE